MSKNKNSSSYLLIANGDVTPELIARVDLSSIDRIIATDGAAVKALACGVTPDVVIGDFDSLPGEFQKEHGEINFLHRPSQEENDLEKALQYCENENVQKVTLIGVTGDRIDHTMNNFSVLAKYDEKFEFRIYCPHAQIYFVRKKLARVVQIGQTISLIPLGRVEGINTEGLEFSLNNEVLAFGEREGASNRAIAGTFQVVVQSGLLLVFVNDPD
jgi:thiamine pyrophosphokinase